MTQLKILIDTVLKQRPIQSTGLKDNEKQSVKAGTVLKIDSFSPASDHIKVTLVEPSFQGKNTWYVYQKSAAILSNGEITFPASVKLSVPYYDQLDNTENPYGTCNVTSLAMTLAYLGARRQYPEIRFADELDEYCDNHGLDRHEPTDMVKVMEAYGCKDIFTQNATIEEVKEWLIQGNPVVVHGYFTASGHIVCFIGYNSQGFVVNDPYGEIMYSPDNSYYDIYSNGSGLTYSYSLISEVCCTNNEFWVHFISKT